MQKPNIVVIMETKIDPYNPTRTFELSCIVAKISRIGLCTTSHIIWLWQQFHYKYSICTL